MSSPEHIIIQDKISTGNLGWYPSKGRISIFCRNISLQHGKNPFKLNRKPKAREVSFAYDVYRSHPIILKFCPEHAVLCAKFLNDWTNDMFFKFRKNRIWVSDESHLGFGRISYISTAAVSLHGYLLKWVLVANAIVWVTVISSISSLTDLQSCMSFHKRPRVKKRTSCDDNGWCSSKFDRASRIHR